MENEKKLILGLDVSTTTIGCCLMLTDGVKKEIIKVTSVSPKVDKKIKGIESLFIKFKNCSNVIYPRKYRINFNMFFFF